MEELRGRGLPGSAQIILNSSTLQSELRGIRTIKQLKRVRDEKERESVKSMEKTEVADCLLRESLFNSYDSHLNDVKGSKQLQEKNEHEQKLVIDSLNQHWGMWLQSKLNILSHLEENMLREKWKSSHRRGEEACAERRVAH